MEDNTSPNEQQHQTVFSSSWNDGNDQGRSSSRSLSLSMQKEISPPTTPAALGMTLSTQASTSSSIPATEDSTTTTNTRNDLGMSSSSVRRKPLPMASPSSEKEEADDDDDCSASSSSCSSSSTSSVSTSKYALHFDSSFSLSDSDDNGHHHHIVFKNRSKKKNQQAAPSRQPRDKKNGTADNNKKKPATPSLPVSQDKKPRATRTKKKQESYSSLSVSKSQSARQLLSSSTPPTTTSKTKEPRKAKSARQLVKSPTSKKEDVGLTKDVKDSTTTNSKSKTKTKKKRGQDSDHKKTKSYSSSLTKSQSARQLVSSSPTKSPPKTIKAHSARHLLESPTQEGDRIILPSTMVPPKQKKTTTKKKKSNVTKAEKTSSPPPTRGEARPSSRTSMTLVDDFVSIYQDVMEKQDETHKKEKEERKTRKKKKHAPTKPKSMPKLNIGTDEVSPKPTKKPSSARILRASTTTSAKSKSTKKLSKVAKASSRAKARSDSSSPFAAAAAAAVVSSPAPSPRKVRHQESKSPSPRKPLTPPSKRFSFSPAVSPQVDGLRATTIAKHMQEAAAAAAAAREDPSASSPSSTCSGESIQEHQSPALGLPTPPLVSPEPRESPATVDDSNVEKASKAMDVQPSNGLKESPPSKSKTIDPPWPPVQSRRGSDSTKPLLTITSPIGSPRGSVASLTNHFEKQQQSPTPLSQDSPSATAASSPRPSLMNALRPPLASPRSSVKSPRNSLIDHFGKDTKRKKQTGSSSAASAPVTSSHAPPLLKLNKKSSAAKTSPKPPIASHRSGRSTQRLQKKSPLVNSTRKNKSLSDHFGNDSSSGQPKKQGSSSIVSAPVLGSASPRSSTISPSIASRLKVFEQTASSSDSFAKMPPPLPLETLSPKTESPSNNAQRRLLFAKSRSERGFMSSEVPVDELQQGRRRGRMSDFAPPTGSRQRSMDKAVFSSSSSSKFTRTTSPSPLIRAKQRHALSARADAGDIKPLLQSGSSLSTTPGCQVAPLTTAQVQDKFHLDQEGVGNLSKVIQKTKHKVASSHIGGKHKEEVRNADSSGLPGILRKSSSSFSVADDEERRTTTVRFHTIVQTHRISLAGASFYTDEEIANFRYEKFCEDCGIDPADFD